MEESDRDRDRSFSGDASTSREEVPVIDDDDQRPPLPFPERNSVFHNAPYFPATHNEEAVRLARDETCSSIVVILTFWFFGKAFSKSISILCSSGNRSKRRKNII